MANWFDELLDGRQLKAIYGHKIPSLKEVEFHSLDLHRDGPQALLIVDLSYPDQPPEKWVAAGFNRTQLRLLAFGVHDFKMDGLQRSGKVDIRVDREDNLIHLLAIGTGMSFNLSAEHLSIDGISAYREES